MKYNRLSLEKRERIFVLVNQGKSNPEIAKALDRSHATICSEIRRCGTKFEYSSSKADRALRKNNPLRESRSILDSRPEIFQDVIEKLFRDLSPE